MITQKPISLKIDIKLLDDLDREVATGWARRNNHINRAIRLYLSYKDTFRKISSFGNLSDKRNELQGFIREWFPNMPD